MTQETETSVHQIEIVELAALKPYPQNARKHPKRQLHQLAASIRRFGFTAPIIIDEGNTILAGHGRAEAAKLANLPTVRAIRLTHLSAEEKRAYVLADNKLSLLSEWDEDLLKIELQALTTIDFPIEVTGFSTAETDIIIDGPVSVKPDKADEEVEPQLGTAAVTQPGDIWLLGEHRVLCADATQGSAYAMLMGSSLARLVLTDPPYNLPIAGCVSTTDKYREFAEGVGEMSVAEFTKFLGDVMTCGHQHSLEGAIGAYFMDWRHQFELQQAALPIYGALKQLCVWAKPQGGQGSFYRQQHELVFLFKKGDVPHVNNFELGQNGRYRTNLWTYPNPNRNTKGQDPAVGGHPTPKPVSLVADCIRDLTNRHDIVLDPFLGSGTTIIAAEKTGRICYGMELDPLYVDALVRRWQRYANKTAIRESDRVSFDEAANSAAPTPEAQA